MTKSRKGSDGQAGESGSHDLGRKGLGGFCPPVHGVPGAGEGAQSDLPVRFREISSTESEHGLAHKTGSYMRISTSLAPLSYRGYSRLFFWKPAGDTDEIIRQVAVVYLTFSPISEVDRGRQRSHSRVLYH